VKWDASPGAALCRKEHPGLTYAPKNDEDGNPMLPAWFTDKSKGGNTKGGGGGSGRQNYVDKSGKGSSAKRDDNVHPSQHKLSVNNTTKRGVGGSPTHSFYEPPPMNNNRTSENYNVHPSRQKEMTDERTYDGDEVDRGINPRKNHGKIPELRQYTNNEVGIINDWLESTINNMNPSECVTNLNISNPNSNSIFFQGGANVPLESEGTTSQYWKGDLAEVGIVKQTLLDTGAWLSYVSLSFANKIEKELKGVRGKGRYKVIDPFQKAHYFFDDISFCISLNTGGRQ
jgi:hypothetical protein